MNRSSHGCGLQCSLPKRLLLGLQLDAKVLAWWGVATSAEVNHLGENCHGRSVAWLGVLHRYVAPGADPSQWRHACINFYAINICWQATLVSWFKLWPR